MSDIMDLFPGKVLPEPNSGCWLWTGSVDTGGYAQTSMGKKRPLLHRLSYRMSKGAIPEGYDTDHLCRVRCCVNPDHLEPVTEQVNTLRSPITLAGQNARKTHCKRGHLLEGWNLIQTPARKRDTGSMARPGRSCRTCMYARIEERRQRLRQGIASVTGYSGRPRGAGNRNSRPVVTPDGRFPNVAAAADHFGIPWPTAYGRTARGNCGWRFADKEDE